MSSSDDFLTSKTKISTSNTKIQQPQLLFQDCFLFEEQEEREFNGLQQNLLFETKSLQLTLNANFSNIFNFPNITTNIAYLYLKFLDILFFKQDSGNIPTTKIVWNSFLLFVDTLSQFYPLNYKMIDYVCVMLILIRVATVNK